MLSAYLCARRRTNGGNSLSSSTGEDFFSFLYSGYFQFVICVTEEKHRHLFGVTEA
jgi:hypothetical protein